jgi:hypothetical protein
MNEIELLRGLLHSVAGTCPDCADERFLLPVDDEELEWCCVECGAALFTGHSRTAPASRRTPSRVA